MNIKERIIEYINKQDDVINTLHEPSISLSGSCLRRLDYDNLLGAKPLDPMTWMRFGLGDLIHGYWQKKILVDVFGANFNAVEKEVTVKTSKGNVITGHIDGTLVIDGIKYLLEIKSCSDSVYDMVVERQGPLGEHFEQANLYAHAEELKKVLFLYVNKNNSEFIFIPKDYDLAQAQFNLDKWDVHFENKAAKVLSPRPFVDPEGSPCYWCPHKAKCYEGFVNEVANMRHINITDPQVYDNTTQFNDMRLERLRLEKVEDKIMDYLINTMVKDYSASEAIIKGQRSFEIKLKPTPKGRMSAKIKEIK